MFTKGPELVLSTPHGTIQPSMTPGLGNMTWFSYLIKQQHTQNLETIKN